MPFPLALIPIAIGAAQGIIGASRAKKARQALEKKATPAYSPSKSITDYYEEAQRKYNESPYQSNLYKMQAQNIARGTAQGLSYLQDRRKAMAGVPALIQSQNDALLKAGVMAEQQKEQRFGQLGAATSAMSGEQRKQWEIDRLMPYQKDINILGQKASGYTQLMNSGLQNIYGGLQAGIMSKDGFGFSGKKNKGTITVGDAYETPFQ